MITDRKHPVTSLGSASNCLFQTMTDIEMEQVVTDIEVEQVVTDIEVEQVVEETWLQLN